MRNVHSTPHSTNPRHHAQAGNGVIFGLVVTTILVVSGVLVTSKIGQTTDTQYTRTAISQVKADAAFTVAKNSVFEDIRSSLAAGNVLAANTDLTSRNLCIPDDPTAASSATVATTGSCGVGSTLLGSYTAKLLSKRGNFYQTAISVSMDGQTYTFSPPSNVEPDICQVVETKVRDGNLNTVTTADLQTYAHKPCMLRDNYPSPIPAGTGADFANCSTGQSRTITGTDAVQAGSVDQNCTVTIPNSTTLETVLFNGYTGSVALTSTHTNTTARTLYLGNVNPQTSGNGYVDASTGLHNLFINNLSGFTSHHLFNGTMVVLGSYSSSAYVNGSASNDTLVVKNNDLAGSVDLATGHDRVFLGSTITGAVNLDAGQNLFYSAGTVTGVVKTLNSTGGNLLIFGSAVDSGNFADVTGTGNVVMCKAGSHVNCDGNNTTLINTGLTSTKIAREIVY